MKTFRAWDIDVIKVNERLIYYLTISVAIWVFLYVLSKDLLQARGEDVNIYCLAGQAIRHGQNPYFTENLGTSNSWNYLPIYAQGFRVLCSHLNFQNTYIFFYFPFIFFSLEPWVDDKSWIYGIVLCATGLVSFDWTIITGNISLIELLLLSISAALLFRKKIALAFFLFGLNASIKIIPILYFPIFLLFTQEPNQRKKAFFWTAIGFLLPFLISLIFDANLIPWYFKQLFGLIPNQHSAFNEYDSFHYVNPLFISFILNLAGIDTVIKINFYTTVLVFIAGIGALYVLWRKIKPFIKSDYKIEIVYCIGMVISTLLMPRLKPYSFLPAVLFFYVASKGQAKWIQSIYLILLSILPNLLSYSYAYDVSISVLDKLPHYLDKPFQTIQIFHQPLFLLLTIIIFIASIKNTVFRIED